ncbi:hypothetical protein MIDIC_150008 [Alphaproteobacteria bacterium]
MTQEGMGAMVGMTAAGICCVFQRMRVVFKEKNTLQRSSPPRQKRNF